MTSLSDLSGFRCIVADPPWAYKSKGSPCWKHKKPETCLVEYYYPTMKLSDIQAMPVSSVADANSVLFLWATVPMIQEAFETMKAWGWKYKTMLTWHKTNRDCMGYWFRVCTEHLIVDVRGKVPAFRSMRRTLFETPRGKHSEKPEEAFTLIEAVSPGPRLELFARRPREGWTVRGNEVEANTRIADTGGANAIKANVCNEARL